MDPKITKEEVKEVVNCQGLRSVQLHRPISLGVEKVWDRLAVDVTHYRGTPYLTMVDCGPGRFAIWREMKDETAGSIVTELRQVFWERGPVTEVLLDNATAFRAECLTGFFEEWNTHVFYRAAYRPSGNGIVERNHRTVKAMAERSNVSPVEAAFYYNSSPRYGQQGDSVPQKSVFSYEWRQPTERPGQRSREEQTASVRVGDEVWVKPPVAKCTAQWGRGRVTKVNSKNNIEVDHMPRHVLDLRMVGDDRQEADAESEAVEENDTGDTRRYPQRDRRVPLWMDDYVR